MKTRLIGNWHERNMAAKWWAQFKRFRLTWKIPKAKQAPFRLTFFGNSQFVSGKIEGGSFPSRPQNGVTFGGQNHPRDAFK